MKRPTRMEMSKFHQLEHELKLIRACIRYRVAPEQIRFRTVDIGESHVEEHDRKSHKRTLAYAVQK